MSLVVCQDGDKLILDSITAGIFFKNYVWHLYKNNYTPVVTSVLGDFTEADFDGYKSGLTVTSWTAAAISSSHAVSTGNVLTWTKAAGATSNNIYGVYVSDSGGKTLCYAERDPSAPVSMSVTGATYSYTPSFSTISEF